MLVINACDAHHVGEGNTIFRHNQGNVKRCFHCRFIPAWERKPRVGRLQVHSYISQSSVNAQQKIIFISHQSLAYYMHPYSASFDRWIWLQFQCTCYNLRRGTETAQVKMRTILASSLEYHQPSARALGSKSLLQQNPPVLSWGAG